MRFAIALHKPISVCLFILVFVCCFFFFVALCLPLYESGLSTYVFLPFAWRTNPYTNRNAKNGRWSCAPIEFYLHDFDCIIYGLLRRQPKSNEKERRNICAIEFIYSSSSWNAFICMAKRIVCVAIVVCTQHPQGSCKCTNELRMHQA